MRLPALAILIFVTCSASANGPYLVKDITTTGQNGSSEPNEFTSFRNQIYFSADDGIHGRELWTK